jgi:hypothetical protein
MSNDRRPRRVRVPSAPVDGPLVREELPYPVVHYPRRGVWIGFAADEGALPALCACARPALENAMRLRAERLARDGSAVSPVLDPAWLPDRLAEWVGKQAGALPASIPFLRAACHRCNLAPPTLRYCHDLEGGRFLQYYGWYVAQAYYRYGIDPDTLAYLPDVCPEELRPYVETIAHSARLLGDAPWDGAAEADTGGRLPGLHAASLPVAAYRSASRAYRRACGSLDRTIENTVRQEFGFRPVGEGWVSEVMLYQIVRHLYPETPVLRRQRPAWLDGLELDVYLPDRDLAFEYQGQQHYHPVKVWGGEEALRELQARDARKAALCAQQDVTLVTIDYTEPLSEIYVRERVEEANLAKVRKPSQG